MRLYEVTNGYEGNSYVRCLVAAASPEQAIELAGPKFEAQAEGRATRAVHAVATQESRCPPSVPPFSPPYLR